MPLFQPVIRVLEAWRDQRVVSTARIPSDCNNEGKISSMTYPSTVSGSTTTPGPSYNYSYDSMYRLSGMTSGSTTIVNGVSYNPANQLLGITYNGYAETRTYNALNQLITLKVQAGINTFENLTYNYPTGANNGKLSSINNAVSGETVTYAYDSLNRLLTASGSGWGESYGFDPFGNLLSKTVTSGSGPSLSQTVNTANNRVGGLSYDANGNPTISFNGTQEVSMTYDAENRLVGAANFNGPPMSIYYAYDGQNRRIFSWNGSEDSLSNPINYTVNVYTPGGQKLAAYTMSPAPSSCGVTPCLNAAVASSDQYFGGRRLAVMDQLGSTGTSSSPGPSYFPWGEPRGTNPQDAWSYASYWTDSATGLDYANNRYYSNAYGRFMTPDPYRATAKGANNPHSPQSWNRYAYTTGDPVNFLDPTGLMEEEVCDFDGNDASCDGGSGDDGGDQAGGGGSTDPLQCWLAGFTTSIASFQYFAGTPASPRTYWYFGVPINLYFQASGGTGNYTFQIFPYISSVGTSIYQGGAGPVTSSSHPDPVNAGGFVQSGADATFSDAPGIPYYVPTNGLQKLISASVTFYGTTIAWVTSGGVTVDCGTVYWTATVSVEADAVLSTAGYLYSGESTVTSYSP